MLENYRREKQQPKPAPQLLPNTQQARDLINILRNGRERQGESLHVTKTLDHFILSKPHKQDIQLVGNELKSLISAKEHYRQAKDTLVSVINWIYHWSKGKEREADLQLYDKIIERTKSAFRRKHQKIVDMIMGCRENIFVLIEAAQFCKDKIDSQSTVASLQAEVKVLKEEKNYNFSLLTQLGDQLQLEQSTITASSIYEPSYLEELKKSITNLRQEVRQKDQKLEKAQDSVQLVKTIGSVQKKYGLKGETPLLCLKELIKKHSELIVKEQFASSRLTSMKQLLTQKQVEIIRLKGSVGGKSPAKRLNASKQRLPNK